MLAGSFRFDDEAGYDRARAREAAATRVADGTEPEECHHGQPDQHERQPVTRPALTRQIAPTSPARCHARHHDERHGPVAEESVLPDHLGEEDGVGGPDHGPVRAPVARPSALEAQPQRESRRDRVGGGNVEVLVDEQFPAHRTLHRTRCLVETPGVSCARDDAPHDEQLGQCEADDQDEHSRVRKPLRQPLPRRQRLASPELVGAGECDERTDADQQKDGVRHQGQRVHTVHADREEPVLEIGVDGATGGAFGDQEVEGADERPVRRKDQHQD